MPVLKAFENIGHAIEGIAKRRKKGQTLVGDHQSARKSSEKRGAKSLFKQFYLMTDSCLRDAKFDGGTCEAQVAGRRLEGA